MLKKFLNIFLILFLISASCKKNSSDSDDGNNESGDVINVQVKVLENGTPAENIFVFLTATEQQSNYGIQGQDWHTASYTTSQTYEDNTNNYGIAEFRFENKSISERGGIVITKVTMKRGFDILHEDTEEKFVSKNTDLNLQYEL